MSDKQGKLVTWLRKPRLSDEEWRKKAEFVAKAFAVLVAAVWLLLVGTEYFDRQEKVLGASCMPNADTGWSPAGVVYYGAANGQCEVNGQYQITNNGKLAFRIETVTIRIFRMGKPLPSKLGKTSFPNAKVYSSRSRVAKLTPIAADEMPIAETLAEGNRLDASFRLRFNIPDNLTANDQFIVVATGAGALRQPNTLSNRLFRGLRLVDPDLTNLKENDLYISTKTFSIDENDCLSATRPGAKMNAEHKRLEMKIS